MDSAASTSYGWRPPWRQSSESTGSPCRNWLVVLSLSTPALYKHFASKQELLGALALRVVRQVDWVLSAVTHSNPEDPWETLARITRAYAELYVNAPTTAVLMNTFIVETRSLLTEDAVDETWHSMERWWSRLEELLQELGLSRERAIRVGWMVWTTSQGALVGSGFAERRQIEDPASLASDAVFWMLRGSGIALPENAKAIWCRGCKFGARITQQLLLETTDER